MPIASASSSLGTSIQTGEIDDLAVTTAKIAANAVTTAKIGALAVTSAEIAANAVIAGKYGAASIVNADVSTTAAIAGTKLAGIWRTVETIDVGAAVQTQDFAATFDGNTERAYMICGRIVNGAGAAIDVQLRLNGANIAGTVQRITGDGATAGAGRATSAEIFSLASGATGSFMTFLPEMQTGQARSQITHAARDSGTAIILHDTVSDITTPANTANITGIGIGASAASGIGAGSDLKIFMRVA